MSVQQQRQQGHQVQQTVPWRRPRDFVAQSSVVAGPQSGIAEPLSPTPPTPTTPTTIYRRKPTLPNQDQTSEISYIASPGADDRNMFQRYHFQFGSIGNFSRGNDVSNAATPTGSGSWGKQMRYTGSGGSSGPIAVFRFQDFDDMVAKMRDQTAPQTSGQ